MRLTTYLLLCFILGLMQSCVQEDSNSSDAILYTRLAEDPGKLNPVLYPLSEARPVNNHLFLPLAEYNPSTFDYEPVMIKSIPKGIDVDGGIKYEMEIKDNAVWSDGTPITGYDVAFTIKIVNHPQTSASGLRTYLSTISDITVEKDNAKRFTIYFEEDYALSRDAATNFEVLPKHIYDANGVLDSIDLNALQDEKRFEALAATNEALTRIANEVGDIKFAREVVVGSGPYQLKDWITDEAVVLEKVPNYWGNDHNNYMLAQGPSQIIFKIIPDETTALTQLKNGLLDFVPNISSNAYQSLQDSAQQVGLKSQYNMRYFFLLLNNTNPILSTKEARNAVAMVTDVDRMIDVLTDGHAKRTQSFVNPSKQSYNKQIKPVSFNPEAAQKLLMENGWEDQNGNGILDKEINGKRREFEFDYFASGNLGVNIGSILEADAIKAGIKVNVIKKNYGLTVKENINTDDFGAIASAAGQSLGPDDPYLRFHSDNAYPGGPNSANYTNPVVDSLINILRENDDPAIIAKPIQEIQQIIYDEMPIIYLYVPQSLYAYNPDWEISTTVKRPGYHLNDATIDPKK